ncbi:MAG: 3'(2'), 5'-bisphosphate nucleotidase [Candidatus Latescibacterota bacterium]|jgi:3'(2'), 5'-bisphosphate nucleotidase
MVYSEKSVPLVVPKSLLNMNRILTIAIRAALDAGIEILKVYATDFEVEYKGDDSPLTIADKNASAVINGYLEKLDFPIISEETLNADYEERRHWDTCWIVDPLDGTKEFVKRNGDFTVNIALVENGNPILGVIYVPVSKTLYFTSEDGQTAMKAVVPSEAISVANAVASAVSIKPSDANQEVVKIVCSRSYLNDDTKRFISEVEKEKNVERVSRGSSLKFCMVAEGEAHIYPRYAPTMEWDTAAGQAICQAVGLTIIDTINEEPLRYNKENLLNPYFIVSS